MSTMFAAPSPRNTNNANLYLTRAGHLVDRYGRNWGRSQIRKLAMDAALPGPSGPKKPQNPLASGARSDVDVALLRLCEALGLEHEDVAGRVGDILDEAEREQIQEYAQSLGAGGGKGAGAGALDDEGEGDGFEKFRKYLRTQNLDDEAIEAAVAIAKRDHEVPTVDRLPENAIRGGLHGHIGGKSRDEFREEYPGAPTIDVDYDGQRPQEQRFWNNGRDPAERRRLSNDRALATDADLVKDYPGIENTKVGW
jgi:hypothetical protein